MPDDSENPSRAAKPAAAAPAPEPQAAEPHPVEAEIERWFTEHFPDLFRGRPTEEWNRVFAAKEALKGRLVALVR